uniref:Uncharacterized protein n=1 Tax=Rhizophora mucronata TaxID=61149 RepID=A0A2P2N8D1_RHIMU
MLAVPSVVACGQIASRLVPVSASGTDCHHYFHSLHASFLATNVA